MFRFIGMSLRSAPSKRAACLFGSELGPRSITEPHAQNLGNVQADPLTTKPQRLTTFVLGAGYSVPSFHGSSR